jgi:hypothetical protein
MIRRRRPVLSTSSREAVAAWTQQAYLKASNTGRVPVGDEVGDGDEFGFSLALSADGNTLAAGAVSEDGADDKQAQSGAVYVFTRSGSTWAQQALVKGSNTEAGDLFGYGVALSDDGNTMAVAGYDEDGSGKGINPPDDNSLAGSGAIYCVQVEAVVRGRRRRT